MENMNTMQKTYKVVRSLSPLEGDRDEAIYIWVFNEAQNTVATLSTKKNLSEMCAL